MSQNVTLFQIFGTKLRLPFMFGSGSERLLELVSPLNRAKSGRHFQTFEVGIFVPAIFWFLVVRRVKMWLDRKKKKQKRFLVPRLLGITYVGTSIVSSAAVGICARNLVKHLKAS